MLVERHLYQEFSSLAINWRYKMHMASWNPFDTVTDKSLHQITSSRRISFNSE
jgi:hypothetical protein